MLLEQWTSCGGLWRQSDFFFKIKNKSKQRTYGARRWLTRAELHQKYGDSDVVSQIIAAKSEADVAATQIRPHPDMNGVDTPESCKHTVTYNQDHIPYIHMM